MGLCINIFGLPILEDAACAAARREERTDRVQIREEQHTANVDIRNTQQLGSDIAQNFGTQPSFWDSALGVFDNALTGASNTAATVFGPGGAGSTAAGAYSTGGLSLLGGIDPVTGAVIPPSPIVPIGLVAAALGLAYVATR